MIEYKIPSAAQDVKLTLIEYRFMKKTCCYLSIILIALFAASCKSDKKFNSHGFEGQYEMRTNASWLNDVDEVQTWSRTIVSPVHMYVENDHLYIRTNGFGMPNMGDYDLEEIQATTDPPMETPAPAKIIKDDNGDSEGGEGIENVQAPLTSYLIIRDGMVYVIKDNKYLKSLPIQALDVKEDRILFKNSETFDVAITDAAGLILGTWRCHYEYGPAILKDGTITWDVELCVDPGTNSSGIEHNFNIKYHNTLVRK